jgi:hypothetical protein
MRSSDLWRLTLANQDQVLWIIHQLARPDMVKNPFSPFSS